MTSIDDVLAAASPKTATARICPRGDLIGKHAQLELQLAQALLDDRTENRHAQAPDVAMQIEALEKEIREASVEFEFASIGRAAWTLLMAQNPPEPEQRQIGYEFDPQTFPVAAVAATCTSHPMKLADAEKLSEKLDEGAWRKLWNAVLTANADGRNPFSEAAFVMLHGSETKSERPEPTESPAASS